MHLLRVEAECILRPIREGTKAVRDRTNGTALRNPAAVAFLEGSVLFSLIKNQKRHPEGFKNSR